jgi:hypothetical protein
MPAQSAGLHEMINFITLKDYDIDREAGHLLSAVSANV